MTRTARYRNSWPRIILSLLSPLCLLAGLAGAQTITTLQAPAAATTGQAATFTASVSGSGGQPVTAGTVTFLNGAKTLGTVQLVGNNPAPGFTTGTAVLKTRLAVGQYSISAKFNGTRFAPASTSAASSLTVSGSAVSSTVLTVTPDGNNYDFTATVMGYGLAAPTGMVTLTDTTVPIDLGSHTWQPSTSSQSVALGQMYPLGNEAGNVAVGDFNGDGIIDLVVVGYGDAAYLMLGNIDGTFQNAPTISLPAAQQSVAVGDFNGDGNLDLIFAVDPYNITGNGGVYVALGNGDGTFQAPKSLGVSNVWAVAVEDFNGDGLADIVAVSSMETGVSVLLGNGDGTFQAPVATSLPGIGDALAVGDFNGDGKPDLIVSAWVNGNYGTTVLLGQGDGTFQFRQGQGIQSSMPAEAIAVGDFNGDGRLDVAVFPGWESGTGISPAVIELGNGDGTFQPAKTYTAGLYGRTGAVGDFDGDGILDLAVANENSTVTLLRGNGDGTFQPAVGIGVAGLNQPVAVAAGKFTGDGSDGLVVSNTNPGSISVLLHSASLSATATNVPVVGAGGNHTIKATYTPDASSSYSGSTGSVDVYVNPITPTITWATPAPITYGTALWGAQLNASSSVPGTFRYFPLSGTQLPAGAQTLTVTFFPTDQISYNVATTTVPLMVNQVTPVLKWNTPAAMTYGTALWAGQLNASASIPGSYAYSPAAGTVLPAGTQTLTATFLPNDAMDYVGGSVTTTVNVARATPVITWSPLAAVPVGTALSATQLNASASVSGIFTYTPAAGTVLSTSGTQTLSVSFIPTDTNSYTATSATKTIAVVGATAPIAKTTPVITWAKPTAITAGTPLSSAQLNASASVQGTFTYSPAAGTVLPVGTQVLVAAFTPTDTTHYNVTGAISMLTVNAAPVAPKVTWNQPAAITYGTALWGAQLNASSNVAGTFAYTPASGTILQPGTQTLSVTFAPTNTASAPVTVTVPLVVNKVASVLKWNTPAAMTSGMSLWAGELNASSSVQGTFTYTPAAGTVLTTGTYTLSATFTPTDSVHYTGGVVTTVATVK